MKNYPSFPRRFLPILGLVAALSALVAPRALAQNYSPARVEVDALHEDYRTSPMLPDEFLDRLEAIVAQYPSIPSDDFAHIQRLKGVFLAMEFGELDEARAIFNGLLRDHPNAPASGPLPNYLRQIDQMEADGVKPRVRIGKPAPEINFMWSTKEGVKKLSDLRGQVVVIDFWATWCAPCIRSFPQIAEEVDWFKGTPVVFLGVTSIQGEVSNLRPGGKINVRGNPQREMALMPEFMEEWGMTWDVVFSEEKVFNPDYGVEGIPHMAIIAPDGTVRYRKLHPSNANADLTGKVTALLEEFELPTPQRGQQNQL